MKETKIKICGLSRDIDIDYVNETKPDFVGFVFADSKRNVSPDQAAILRKKLNTQIQTVGVFVNEAVENIILVAEHCSLNIVQLHGNESQQDIDTLRDAGLVVWRAMRIRDEEGIRKAQAIQSDRILLDTYVSGEYGGSGKRFDLALLDACSGDWIAENVILAGGLNANNIISVLKDIQPYAVDISSGVETDGYKDFNKIQLFCQAVRNKNIKN